MPCNLTDGIKHLQGFCLHPQGRRVIGSQEDVKVNTFQICWPSVVCC